MALGSSGFNKAVMWRSTQGGARFQSQSAERPPLPPGSGPGLAPLWETEVGSGLRTMVACTHGKLCASVGPIPMGVSPRTPVRLVSYITFGWHYGLHSRGAALFGHRGPRGSSENFA